MKAVRLTELRSRLGVYMRQVRAGKAVAITDRGKVVAKLGPPRADCDAATGLPELARKGDLTLAKPCKHRERAALYPALLRALRGRRSTDLLNDERGER